MTMLAAVLFLLVTAGSAVAAADVDRDLWLDDRQQVVDATTFWAMGAATILHEVAESYGCLAPRMFSGRTLRAATADVLREKPTMKPVIALMLTYGRLSDCEEAMATWGRRLIEVKRERSAW